MAVIIPTLPTAGPDIYSYLVEIDAAILQSAIEWNFETEVDVPPFENFSMTPTIVYELIQTYKERQFQVLYFGNTGKLRIRWSNPNIFDGDVVSARSFSKYESIFELGFGFRASLLYLSMTNGEDFRRLTPNILKRQIVDLLKVAHARGDLVVKIPFGRCSVESLQVLYSEVVEWLESSNNVEHTWDAANHFLVITIIDPPEPD